MMAFKLVIIAIFLLSSSKLLAVVHGITASKMIDAVGLRISLKYDSHFSMFASYEQCSGFIAQQNTIITSAHCVFSLIKNYPKKSSEKHTGNFTGSDIEDNFELSVKTDQSMFYQKTQIVKIQVHPKYKYLKKSLDPHDIAIIWIRENQNTKIDKKTFSRINGLDALGVHDWVYFVGFGAVSYESGLLNAFRSFGSKKLGRNQIQEITDTAMFTWHAKLNQENELFSSFAPGDSGGPVYNDHNEVVGLITGFSKVTEVNKVTYRNHIVMFSQKGTAQMIQEALNERVL